jgi:hypothetical protein
MDMTEVILNSVKNKNNRVKTFAVQEVKVAELYIALVN